VDDAQDALMKELDGAYWSDKDKGYGMELADQNANPVGVSPIMVKECTPYGQVSRVTGKALVLPDDNQCPPPKMPNTCCICGCKDQDYIKFYRQDLKRFYCSTCYHFNHIDLKPVIRS
jgi:hypothetical protein